VTLHSSIWVFFDALLHREIVVKIFNDWINERGIKSAVVLG